MQMLQLELFNFRSYQEAELTFAPGVNVLVGSNGVGKTNLAEAVGYLSTLSSHRVASDLPLVRKDADQAVLRAGVNRGQRQIQLEIAINPGRANRLQLSGSPVRATDFVSQLQTVVFAPEDLALVKGDPGDRRRFLDDLLVARAPRYHAVKADYDRVVRQRTTLLRSIAGTRGASARSGAESTVLVWDDQLVSHGASLLFGRLSLLNEISSLVSSAYEHVAPGRSAGIAYQPRSFADLPGDASLPRDRDALEDLLRKEIALRRNEEFARGVTVVGPHRDDVLLTIGELPAKGYASHGECWSMALALRLASFELMRGLDDVPGDPVLVLDDVFAELDATRRSALAAVAMDAEQTIITAAVGDDVPHALTAKQFHVSPGEVTNV